MLFLSSIAIPSANYFDCKSFSASFSNFGSLSSKFIEYATIFDSLYLPGASINLLLNYFRPWQYKFGDSFWTILRILIFFVTSLGLMCFQMKNLGYWSAFYTTLS